MATVTIEATASFWDLHLAIQDSLGWQDKGLHEFIIEHPSTQKPARIALIDEGFGGYPTRLSFKTKLADYFSKKNNIAYYHYPLGAEWQLKITFEKTLNADNDKCYPCCISGERLSPPEPGRGQGSYNHWPRILLNPRHPKYQNLLEKLNAYCDQKPFDCEKVEFCDPPTRLAKLCD